MSASIKALHYFLTAAERGSISQAAEALHVVPSAISNAIDVVEAQFQLKLVQRYPAKGIRPTAAGLVLMRKARHLIEEYDAFFLEGAELRGALSGSLTVGYYAPVAPAFMPSIAGPLVRDNPEVRLNLVECDNEAAQSGLLDGAYDAIVFVAETVRAGIVWERLIEAPPYVLLPAGHALSGRRFVALKNLAGQPFVLLDLPFTSAYYRSLIEEHAAGARIVARANTTEMVRSLVGAGLGCSILNMRPSTATTYAGDALAAVPIRSEAKPLTLAVGHMGGKTRRLTRAFLDACKRAFAEPEASRLVVRRPG